MHNPEEENVSTETSEKAHPCSNVPKVPEMRMRLQEAEPISELQKREENLHGYTGQHLQVKSKGKSRSIYFQDTGPKEKNTEMVYLPSKIHRARGAV